MSRLQHRSERMGGQHADVNRISTPTIIFGFIIVELLHFELRIDLLPFLISGVVAYVCTPVVNWLASRPGSRRTLLAVAAFPAGAVPFGIAGVIIVVLVALGFKVVWRLYETVNPERIKREQSLQLYRNIPDRNVRTGEQRW